MFPFQTEEFLFDVHLLISDGDNPVQNRGVTETHTASTLKQV